jgi:CRP-like cAMP-binding protein
VFVARLLAGAPPRWVAWATPRLVAAARDLRFGAGETIYRIGDPAETGFFVVSGSVELAKPGFRSVAFGEASIIGMLDAFLARPRSRDATAVRATRLLEIAASDWFDVMEDSIDMAMFAIDSIATSVHASHRVTPPEPVRDDAVPAALTLVDCVHALHRVSYVCGARVQTLVVLAEQARAVRLEAGELLHVATREREIFVVVAGEVEMIDGARTETFASGALVGGAAAFATSIALEARATRPTLMLCVTMEHWIDVMEEHFDLTRSIMRALVTQREAIMTIAETPPAESTALSLGAAS